MTLAEMNGRHDSKPTDPASFAEPYRRAYERKCGEALRWQTAYFMAKARGDGLATELDRLRAVNTAYLPSWDRPVATDALGTNRHEASETTTPENTQDIPPATTGWQTDGYRAAATGAETDPVVGRDTVNA